MDLETLQRYDTERMYHTYDRWPEIARNSYEENLREISHDGIDHIVFAGMGGSGALGDIFASILSKTDIHVKVVKGYLLPKTVDSNTLVVVTSVSGNTVEALTVLDAARNIDCKIVAFSAGGKMAQFCEKNKIEYRNIPMIHSPRASFTAYLYSMLKILGPVLPIKHEDVGESLENLENMRSNIFSGNLTDSNQALTLAEWISGIPMIYYPFGLKAAAIRFKNSLQENAKMHAMAEDVVEACHNGIVSWEQPSTVQPILIKGVDDYIKTKERWSVIEEFFESKNIDYRSLMSINGNIISKLINFIFVLDFCSIYKAVLAKRNPSPVESIDFIKKRQ